MNLKQLTEKCLDGKNLTDEEASHALEIIMTNGATEAQIAGLLVAMRAKGETVDELFGFARTMREKAIKVRVEDPDAIDMCGTGGDGLGTFNISTAAALVAAGAGVTVAKHGNRSVSSKSGSADFLAALGVNIQLPPDKVEQCVNKVGIGFLFAPMFHPAMKSVGKTRTELGIRTIFNMLGPITNPAGVRNQLIGTFKLEAAPLLAGALEKLQTERACVVHSDDGMDEVTISGRTSVFEVNAREAFRKYFVSPEHFGLKEHDTSSVRGGSAEDNASIAMRVFRKEPGPYRDVVVANAAFGIYVAGKAKDLGEASHMAAVSLDSGAAMKKLNQLIEYTNAT